MQHFAIFLVENMTHNPQGKQQPETAAKARKAKPKHCIHLRLTYSSSLELSSFALLFEYILFDRMMWRCKCVDFTPSSCISSRITTVLLAWN